MLVCLPSVRGVKRSFSRYLKSVATRVAAGFVGIAPLSQFEATLSLCCTEVWIAVSLVTQVKPFSVLIAVLPL